METKQDIQQQEDINTEFSQLLKDKHLSQAPNWLLSLKQGLSKNQQLQYSKYFALALYNHEKNHTFSDYMRCELILEKKSDLTHQNKEDDSAQYLTKPSIVACFDSRSDIGQAITSSKQDAVEICWFFSLTREKIRLLSNFVIQDYKKSGTETTEQFDYSNVLKTIWNRLSDEEHLVYKRPMPGQDKQDIKDELLQYEPQCEDEIPSNFKIIIFTPFEIDHFMFAPPAVIADQRRKPQQYESLAQPFKKDRRFKHLVEVDNDKQWITKELREEIPEIFRQSNAGGQYWASSNIDEEEKQPGLRDKKYEGYSNLKASHEQQQKKTLRQKENILAKGLEEEYILNMQKQVVLMEHEIKLLKDREVDQKNKASGYETLLRDGIPLNEHFLALKNKFNNEKDDLEKFVHGLEDEIKRDEMNNKNKRHKIEILKREYDEINQRYQIYKDHTQKQMKDLETKLYSEKHTKVVLDRERLDQNKKLNDVKNTNQQMAREIQRNKMFNKKDEDRKKKKEDHEKLAAIIREQNKNIEMHDILLDQEERKLADKNLLRKQEEATRQLKQENGKIHIDINIAESRIKDLEGLREMTLSSIKEILTEKRQVDLENIELDSKIQGRGISEQEAKARQIDAEKEQLKKISNSLKFQKETATFLMSRLGYEETKAKDMLDEKIKQTQLLTQHSEDLSEMKAISTRNREEIIKLQIKLSQLQAQEEKSKVEFVKFKDENDYYLKENQKLELDNEKLSKDIKTTIQKIDINALLKEIDIEDMRLLAQNNKSMNHALHNLIGKWEMIQQQEIELKK
eukprot:403335260